ncbi:MAG: DUF2203 domain-containing protein [Solirubrobacterales bacterium]
MIHERHYSREEAEAALDEVEPLLSELREAKDSLTDAEAHAVLSEAAATNGGGAEGRSVGQAFLRVRELLTRFNELGIVIRDIDRGLIDFPAIVDDDEVYLCWHVGEDGISFWHPLDGGFAERQPLD